MSPDVAPAAVSASAPLLRPAAFASGHEAWCTAVRQDGNTLRQAFSLIGGQRLGSLAFATASIRQLLSAGAVRFVQARFVLLPSALTSFGLVLFATDEAGQPLTAYYGPGLPLPAPDLGTLHLAVPPALATQWTTNWAAAAPPARGLFWSGGAPLEGFSFEAEAFGRALLAAPAAEQLHVLLALHQFHAPDSTGELTERFGLLLAAPAANGCRELAPESMVFEPVLPVPPYQ